MFTWRCDDEVKTHRHISAVANEFFYIGYVLARNYVCVTQTYEATMRFCFVAVYMPSVFTLRVDVCVCVCAAYAFVQMCV